MNVGDARSTRSVATRVATRLGCFGEEARGRNAGTPGMTVVLAGGSRMTVHGMVVQGRCARGLLRDCGASAYGPKCMACIARAPGHSETLVGAMGGQRPTSRHRVLTRIQGPL